MSGNGQWRRRGRAARAGVAAVLLALAVGACTSSPGTRPSSAPSASGPSASGPASAVSGGTARVALPAGMSLDWIWPYGSRAKTSAYNVEGFQQLLYRPLYTFGDDGPSVTVNYPLSLADAPVYSGGGKTVTITLKSWKWSDGESVDASDVIFWLNLMRAEPKEYHGYVPGLLPDNLSSYGATGPDTVVLHLKSPVSSLWFTYDQLAEITPMPTAWDVTSAGAAAGSGRCAADSAQDGWAACAAVFRFLDAQAGHRQSYGANPLWGVVDGPWKLSAFSTAASGPVASFVPNRAYSGSPRPQLAGLTYYAYPGSAAEFSALRAGRLDVGYVPPEKLPAVPAGQTLPAGNPLGSGFTLSAAYPFGLQFLELNYRSPAVGPAFRQLYVRQALQELVDQQTMVTSADHGYGFPASGGVPTQPANPWAGMAGSGHGLYRFSPGGATALLFAHGWRNQGGVLTCTVPALCGAGVAAGTKLSLTLDYPAGVSARRDELALIRSDAAQAGIRITLAARPSDAGSAGPSPCPPGPECAWDLFDSAGWDFAGPGYEPVGGQLFATGAAGNAGGYSDAMEDRLIGLTRASSSPAVFQQYATYTAAQLPVLWMPGAYTVTAVSSRLANVANSPLTTLLPEYWAFTR